MTAVPRRDGEKMSFCDQLQAVKAGLAANDTAPQQSEEAPQQGAEVIMLPAALDRPIMKSSHGDSLAVVYAKHRHSIPAEVADRKRREYWDMMRRASGRR